MIAVDLFAGPGGWDLGARALGVDPLGIELDDAACRVREAAGLRTVQADVSALDPTDFPCDVLIASPPCTAFSMAGKGGGRRAIDTLLACVRRMGEGETVDQAVLDAACSDETAHLVLEPLRWALAISPRAIACEQVPPVLPLWEAMANVLSAHGYGTWTGLETAEQFGVPQTRQRAFLIASSVGPVSGPVRTHRRYVAPRRELDQDSLFEPPARQRIVAPGDEGLLPWVSMAQALGWDEGPSPAPAPTVTSGGADTGGVEVFASKGARARARAAVRTHQSTSTTGERYERGTDAPSPTIVGRTDLWEVTHQRRDSGPAAERAPRSVDDPSYTIRSAGSGSAPAGVEWVVDRPATTIAGDARVFQPGGHHTPGAQSENAVRVTVEQAACLQSFPDGYPWMAAGSKSAAFKCIGNAVPPLMAGAVLAAAVTVTSAQKVAA